MGIQVCCGGGGGAGLLVIREYRVEILHSGSPEDGQCSGGGGGSRGGGGKQEEADNVEVLELSGMAGVVMEVGYWAPAKF